jgi:hypothetical protein
LLSSPQAAFIGCDGQWLRSGAQGKDFMKRRTLARIARLAAWTVLPGAAGFLAYSQVIRPWHLKWGATREEARRRLPGDELVPEAKLIATHAVTIRATPEAVWPWLIQMGQGRGGLYSYDWLENLFGLGIHSADRILPEFQNLEVGDILPLAPEGFGPRVAALEPCRALVLHGDSRRDPQAAPLRKVRPGDYVGVSWVFVLDETAEGSTRLLERLRLDWNRSLRNMLFNRVLLEPASFVMERKMLLGIKRRAETHKS